jgi:hypothetical protein
MIPALLHSFVLLPVLRCRTADFRHWLDKSRKRQCRRTGHGPRASRRSRAMITTMRTYRNPTVNINNAAAEITRLRFEIAADAAKRISAQQPRARMYLAASPLSSSHRPLELFQGRCRVYLRIDALGTNRAMRGEVQIHHKPRPCPFEGQAWANACGEAEKQYERENGLTPYQARALWRAEFGRGDS